MAISFSRPDPSSPAAVGSAAFPLVRRGFDQGEVRDFLRMVAAELARLQERERFLESELRAMQTRGMSTPGRLDEETVTTLLGEEAARVLSTARDASLQIRERAEESATRLVKDAAEDASRIREAAAVDAARIRDDAATDAESEIEMAKQQGREMVNEAREYREKVLAELARRRDAAREQIDKLLHGRDRLMNAFERARIASESVIGELTGAHDEPEFIVDLAPTTGPVPVINPAHPSFSPGVKMFDREAEESTKESVQSAALPQRPAPRSVIDIPIDEPVAADAPVHSPSTDMTRPSIEVIEVTDVIDAIVTDAIVTDEEDVIIEEISVVDTTDSVGIDDSVVSDRASDPSGDEEFPPSNVVSLFGRNRRGGDSVIVPEIPVEPVTDRKPGTSRISPASDTADVPAVPPSSESTTPTAAPEVDDHVEPSVEPSSVETPPPPDSSGHRSVDSALDDIFAKLRASSTAEVADKTNSKMRTAGDTRDRESTAATPPPSVPAPVQAPAPVPVPVKIGDEVFAQRDELVTRVAPTISRRLKRELVDEQNSVLEHLRAKKSTVEMDVLFGSVDEHTARYVASVSAEVMEVAGAGAKAARGSTRRVTADDIAANMAAAVTTFIVGEFRADVLAVLRVDDDRAALAERLRDVYRRWKSERLDAVVEDLACAAFGHGVLLSLEPGVKVAWVASPEGCCSDCEDNSLAGAQETTVAFPAGQMNAPAHAGCRCLVWPVRN